MVRSPAVLSGWPRCGPFAHDEQPGRVGERAFGEQVGLDRAGDVGVHRDPALLVALTDHPHPAAADVHIADIDAEDLGRAEPGLQHEPGDGPVPVGAQAAQQRAHLGAVEPAGQPPRLPHPQPRPRLGGGNVPEQSGPLAAGGHPRLAPPRHRVARVGITQLPEGEQPGDRRQPPVHRRRRITGVAAVADRVHVGTRTARQFRGAARGEEPQQLIDGYLLQVHTLAGQPARQVQ